MMDDSALQDVARLGERSFNPDMTLSCKLHHHIMPYMLYVQLNYP